MDSIFFVFEIIGVIAFSLSGALTAMKKEMDIFGACVLGMTTAIGGVLRDVLSMNLPKIFVKHFYACASIAGAIAAFLIVKFFYAPVIASIVGATIVIALRFLASFLRWNLPKPKYPIEEEKS